jgi:hypothetical protein
MSPQLAFSSAMSTLVMAAFVLSLGAVHASAHASAAPPAAPVVETQR